MKMKKVLAFFLSLAIACSMFVGCGSKDTGTPDTSGTPGTTGQDGAQAAADSSTPVVFSAATTTILGSLYPWGVNTGPKQATRGALYEPLFYMDYDGGLHGILVKDYEFLGDGVYELELFDYITDSAGNNLTADDVVFSIDKWIEDGKSSNRYSTLTSYEAIDTYKVRMVFENEWQGAFENCVTYCYCITKAAWDASPDEMYTSPVGTGRYVLTDFVAESWYQFDKRADYWQTDESYICEKNAAKVDTFMLKTVSDATTLAVALETGEIDYATKEILEVDRGTFLADDGTALPGYSVGIYPTTANAHITFNCSENSPCSDINLRKAIAYCIDAAAIAANIQGVYGYVSTSCLVPSVRDADESLNGRDDYYNYNLELAQQYLDQSSYNGETLVMLVKPNDWTWDSAILIEAYCSAIGIKIELNEPENALYNEMRLDETGTKYDMDLGGMSASDAYAWNALVDLDSSTSNTGVSRIMTVDTKLDELYQKAGQKATASVESTNELVQYVDDQCYFYNIFYYPYIFIGNDRIQNMVLDTNLESIFTAFDVTP